MFIGRSGKREVGARSMGAAQKTTLSISVSPDPDEATFNAGEASFC